MITGAIWVLLVAGGLWFGWRRRGSVSPPTSYSPGHRYSKAEIAQLQGLEERFAGVYVSNDWGADFERWGNAVLEELSTEDIEKMRVWYQVAYRQYMTTPPQTEAQRDAQAWIAKSLILFRRLQGKPSLQDQEDQNVPSKS